MTIEKGEAWGRPGPLPADGVVVRADADAREVVEHHRRRVNDAIPALGLLGGDLCRTVGGQGDEARLHSPAAMTLPVDLASVLLDGRQFWFVAHLVARRSWWRGRVVAAMNAQFVAGRDVAPRSHPNDGRLDVLDVDAGMGVRDRFQAWRRLATGTHVPHPAIEVQRVHALQLTFDPALRVWLDGVPMGEARNVSLRVEPDALTVVV